MESRLMGQACGSFELSRWFSLLNPFETATRPLSSTCTSRGLGVRVRVRVRER